MATTKPTKPDNEFLPNGFGTAEGVIKNDFSDTKKLNGFSADVEDILQGDNLNYSLDTIGKQLKYLTTVVDYITSITTNKIPYVDSNNQLNYGDINTFLPSQSGNNGKFLTTNGANQLSWTGAITQIGDPIFTLNFNLNLTNTDYIWLDGTEYDITGDYASLFAIYGYAYSPYSSGTKFKVPNFQNMTIWGGTTAGYIEAGLPNIEGSMHHLVLQDKSDPFVYNEGGAGAFYRKNIGKNSYVPSSITKVGTNLDNFGFSASRSNAIYGKSNTVQPPAIKVRAYTRYK